MLKLSSLKRALLGSAGSGGSDIQVIGKHVTLKDGSQIEASTLEDEAGGILSITARESFKAIGISADGRFGSGLFSIVYPKAQGSGSNLIINTSHLLIQDGARVTTTTNGGKPGGDLTINARESVEVSGIASANSFPSLIASGTI
jgi:hypothetical protein